jgi:sugar lactone lactonase YvrE
MKIRELATGLLFPEGPVAMDDGSVLLVEIARGTLTRVTADGRVQVVADLGAGPNGAAIGPDGAVYICNNGGFEWTRDPGNCLRPIGQAHDYSGGRIERVNLNTGRCERLFDAVDGIGLRGPNDLVFDVHGGRRRGQHLCGHPVARWHFGGQPRWSAGAACAVARPDDHQHLLWRTRSSNGLHHAVGHRAADCRG